VANDMGIIVANDTDFIVANDTGGNVSPALAQCSAAEPTGLECAG
jgi:hypothetical protein